MAPITVKLSLRVAWWVRWYLAGVYIAARLTGATPDVTKVAWWIRRGLSAHASRKP